MKTIGNILWIIFGGLVSAIGYALAGLLLCITIVGIPLGKQMFKFASLVLAPFGQDVEPNFGKHPILNTIWVIFIGLWAAIGNIIWGCILSITIIGIPFGKQWFKIAKLSFAPFGAKV